MYDVNNNYPIKNDSVTNQISQNTKQTGFTYQWSSTPTTDCDICITCENAPDECTKFSKFVMPPFCFVIQDRIKNEISQPANTSV